MNRNEILITYGSNYKQMAKDILNHAKIWDMIGNQDARVGLKPNLVVARDASGGATTHPELLAGAIEVLHEHDIRNISILEGSWVGERTSRAFKACGYEDLAKRYGVQLIDTQRDSSTEQDCHGLPIKVCNSAISLDFMINVPVLKGHCQTGITCALKNMKGVIPDSEKRRFHSLGLHRPIAHLNTAVRQDFILVDGICGDLNFEEGGNPVPMNRVLGFADPVLCDSFVCESMGYAVSEVPYIALAQQLGIGSSDLASAKITELSRPSKAISAKSSRRVAQLAKYADASDACSACYGSLIYALERLDDEGLLQKLPGPICIGQGFKGKSGKIGVGSCTGGFEHSAKGCPPKAVDIVAFIKNEVL